MSEWKKVKIKDIASLSNGINFTKSAYAPGVKIIGVSDFKDEFSPDFSSLQEVKEEIVKRRDYLQFGDILFVRSNGNRDLVGRCMLIDKNIKSTFSGFCIRLRINDLNFYNPYFFTYHFKTSLFRKSIASSAIGANIQNLSQERLGNYELKLPEYFIQCRIAEILFRYDSLIENYQKQIKLLEESAQRLYKEWFVDLRFPGHENTKIENGVPEGWEKKCVDDIYQIKYGKNLSTKLVTVKGNYPVYGANGIIGYYSKSNCHEQVVLITSRGNGSGDVSMTFHKESFITNNSFIVTPLEKYSYCKLAFTYHFLKHANFYSVRTGAAQPQLTNQSIHTVNVLLPMQQLIESYCKLISPSIELISKLKESIHHIVEARDRLLPKLMSGEIEV